MISDIQKHYTIQELAHLDNKFLNPAEQAFFMEKQEDALIAYYDQLKKSLPDGNHNEPAGDIQMRAAIILIVVVIFGRKRRAWLSEHITTKWAFRTWLLP